ncbi:ABC transporter substrate-binding protein [Clostridium sp. SHJSY1]|uniref:ABC transporter substrate-binding protein n=1 Tax=Clostridium sp. SHJSY1 TaxID=2942483 RepID=UPI002875184A|nr:ABC transporter substrate-binding protein [Clostridium sp. SHJSY1]MDS0527958.1 ABC transporter substrate-binding protein [Clostridium sp. SHJSY1]
MKQKFIKITTLFIGATLFLSGCGSGSKNSSESKEPNKVASVMDEYFTATDLSKNPVKERDDTFISTISEPGGVFIPYFYENGWDGNAIDPMFASLVTLDEKGNPVADLAESWDISTDNLVYTYHLKNNLKFSDGSPLTAEDVAFTLTLLDDPSYSGFIDISQASIKGADAYKNGTSNSIEGIKVIDSQTIEITTEKVYPLNLTLLGGQVLSKTYYGKDYQKGKLDYLKALYSKPLGSGPYKLDKYVPGQEIDYVANDNYYGGKPHIKNLIFKVTTKETALQLFQTGETDIDGFNTDQDTIEQLKNLGFANIRISTISDFGLIYINNKKPYLKDKDVRQALIYGLDRQKIVDIKYNGLGEVANVPTAPNLWAYTEEGVTKYDFDQEKAKKLLDDAGWKVGSDGIREKDGKRLQLSYLTSKNNDQIIPVAKENYKEIGIDFQAEVMDSNTMFGKLNSGDYDLVGVRTSGLSDPNDSVAEFASDLPTTQNISGYSNSKVDGLIKEGVNTVDVEKRKEAYKRLYQEFSNDPPIILIDYRKGVKAWNSRIKGIDNDNFAGVSSTNLAKLEIEK